MGLESAVDCPPTKAMPIEDTMISMACTINGKNKNLVATSSGIFASFERVEPKIIAPIISAATDSNTSAEEPTQSPTISPTKSAMVAGLRGSSSGIDCSILPTKSAPTSAALV
eukprot:12089909-Ditylum_brightwellii.AAC.1